MLSDKELAEFKRGPLQMLVLFLLKEADKYGYQLNQELKRRSNGNFVVAGSVLYIVLYRLEEKGYVSKRKEEGGKKSSCVLPFRASRRGFSLRPARCLSCNERRCTICDWRMKVGGHLWKMCQSLSIFG